MAIEKEIPKDIRKYEPKLFGPFTTRQVVCLVPGMILGAAVFVLLKRTLSTDVCLFLSTFVAVPFFLVGWIKLYGLPFEKFTKTVFVSLVLSPPIRKYRTKRLDAETTELARATTRQKKKKKKKNTDPLLQPHL